MTSGREDHLIARETVGTNVMNRRQFLLRTAALGLAIPSFSALLAACETNNDADADVDDDEPVEPDEDDEPDDADHDDDDEVEAATPEAEHDPVAMAPELDLETLEAETPDGTLTAQRAENSYVGEIADGRVIGIAFRSEVGAAEDPYNEDEIVVHLYDRQEAALFLGELDDQRAASLQSLEGGYFEATVDLVMEDDVVTGTVTFRDEDSMSFRADAANGAGGVYWAMGDEDWEFRSADWVVLPDGRQWGAVCLPVGDLIVWCAMRAAQ
ncbi:MAG: hypothetical protein EA415_04255 [Sphaerobacteraceae bacterium]|nr:MAG: hypothetical protein EA415_04255 [Sphaerobacteraceae bacterium]